MKANGAGAVHRANDITLLGPQRQNSILNNVLQRLTAGRSLCAITAGWQAEEGQLDELADWRERVVDLAIYQRSEMIFEHDDKLFQAHRERQATLHELQRLYRLRLVHARQAVIDLQAMSDTGVNSQFLNEQLKAALAALRLLDRQHRRLIQRTHAQFKARFETEKHLLLGRHRVELAELINASQAVLIAGGNVATLAARLRLFNLVPLLVGKPLIAWSAGAMLLSASIVVFHDFPPQGRGRVELLDSGLGLHDWVVLPHARSRLQLDDRWRVANLAQRFAPARCVTLNEGAEMRLLDGQLHSTRNVYCLGRSGRLALVQAA